MVLVYRFFFLDKHFVLFFFFFNDTATTEIYTLSLHDALPVSCWPSGFPRSRARRSPRSTAPTGCPRSEEHTSELQSRPHLVCRLLLEKKKKTSTTPSYYKKTNTKTTPP